MARAAVAAAFQDIEKSRQIGVQIGMGIFQRIAHAGLGGEMNHAMKTAAGEQILRRRAVGEVEPMEGETPVLRERLETRLLQRRVIVVIEAVDAGHGAAGLEQAARETKSDEPCCPGDQDGRGRGRHPGTLMMALARDARC